MTQIPRLVSLGLLGALIALLGFTFFHVLAPFLLPLFMAGVLAMLSQPLHKRVLALARGRVTLAAGLTTAIVLSSLLIPLSLGTILAARQMYAMARTNLQDRQWKETMSFLNDRLRLRELQRWLHDAAGDPVEDEELERELQTRMKDLSGTIVNKTLVVAGATPSLIGGAVAALVSLLTFIVAYYYFLADGPAMLATAERLVPVHRDYKRHILQQFDQAVRAVVVATFAAALAQGLATGIGMQLCGFGHFFIVTMLATLTALVPLLGTWLVWGPWALWLALHDGDWMRAGFLALYGSVFVGLLDNVIRAYVLHSNVKLHPLLAFVSVMGGIQLMGLWGVFVGPVVASCLHALVKIFNTELFVLASKRSASGSLDPDLSVMESGGLTEESPVSLNDSLPLRPRRVPPINPELPPDPLRRANDAQSPPEPSAAGPDPAGSSEEPANPPQTGG